MFLNSIWVSYMAVIIKTSILCDITLRSLIELWRCFKRNLLKSLMIFIYCYQPLHYELHFWSGGLLQWFMWTWLCSEVLQNLTPKKLYIILKKLTFSILSLEKEAPTQHKRHLHSTISQAKNNIFGHCHEAIKSWFIYYADFVHMRGI